MEKFDKHIKTKLEARRMVPSEDAWNKIQMELPSNKRSGGIKKYVWGIAASFIGILLVSGLFYQQEQADSKVNEVVEKTVMEAIPQKESQVVGKTEPREKVLNELDERSMVTKNDERPMEETVAVTETPYQETIQPIKDVAIDNSLDLISIKANEVFAKVEALESASLEGVTDVEVDSLLRAAQKEIIAEKLFDKNGNVDAMALLAEVEDELDESFRDRIFDALKEGYLKLRTAVADRNK